MQYSPLHFAGIEPATYGLEDHCSTI